MRRGFIMVATIYILLILLLIGVGYLSRSSAQYRGAVAMGASLAARGLAEAGIEDARVKLQKDTFFPPPGDKREPRLFGYSEQVPGYTGDAAGSYTVTVDMRYADKPWEVFKVTSVGVWSPPGQNPAQHTVSAEIHAVSRKVINWSEERTINVP